MNLESAKLLLIELLAQPVEVQNEFLRVKFQSSGYSKEAFVSLIDAALNYWNYLIKQQIHENLRAAKDAFAIGKISREKYKMYEKQEMGVKFPLFTLTGGKYTGHIGLEEATHIQNLLDEFKGVTPNLEGRKSLDYTNHSSELSFQNEFMDPEMEIINYLQQYSDLGIKFTVFEEVKTELKDQDLQELGLSEGSFQINYYRNKSMDLRASLEFCKQRWLEKRDLYCWEDFLNEEILFIERFPLELRREYEYQIGPVLKHYKEMREKRIPPLINEPEDQKGTNIQGFKSIFTKEDWKCYVDVLKLCTPQIIDSNNEFIGSPKKHKGVVCSWFKHLQSQGIIKTSLNRKQLAVAINSEFKNLNIGLDGKTFDNLSKTYDVYFEHQFQEILEGLLPR